MPNQAVSDFHDDLRPKLLNLLERFAIEHREVRLASGQISNIYIDCRQIYFRGEGQYLVGELFLRTMLEIETNTSTFAACGGMAMGSIPLSCALSAAAFRRGRELPGFAVRKEAKDHGMGTSIEGNKCLSMGTRVLIVEDVVTTGGSALRAIEQLRALGIEVDTIFAIVDREQGGRERFLADGIQLHALFTLKDLSRVR